MRFFYMCSYILQNICQCELKEIRDSKDFESFNYDFFYISPVFW